MKDADDRRRQAATNANAHLQNANRQGYEKDAQDVREEVRKRRMNSAGMKLKCVKIRRLKIEPDEHRRQQQSAREALAMRDSFENPDADEEYDPYSFGFGMSDLGGILLHLTGLKVALNENTVTRKM